MKKKITILGCMTLMVSAAVVTGYKMYINSDMEHMILNANLEALSEPEGVTLKDCGIRGSLGDVVYLNECGSGTSANYAVPCGSPFHMQVTATAKCLPR